MIVLGSATLAPPQETTKKADRAIQWAFAIFLVLVIVGISPFRSLADDVGSDGEGSALRQALYVLNAVAVFFLYTQTNNRPINRIIPLSTILMLGWLLLSFVWSVGPDLTLRRGIFVVLVATCAFMSVEMLGAYKSLRLLRLILLIVIPIDLLSVPVIPGAVHAYEGGVAWAGMHGQKNIAGAIASLAALLFFHFARTEHRWSDRILLVISIIFLIGTQSKTSLFLLLALILAGSLYAFAEKKSNRQRIFVGVFWVIILALTTVFIIHQEEIFRYLDDPTAFTSRGRIWQIAFSYAANNLWFGAGFGAFWEGVNAPAQGLVGAGWMYGITHAHNSYIEILITTGVFGLALALIAFVIVPIRHLLKFRIKDNLGALVFSWVLFGIFGSITKNLLLDKDGPEWVIFVLALAIIHQSLSARPLNGRGT